MSQRRRKFLQALGVTAAGSLAGCTDSLPLGGSGSSNDAAVPGGLESLTLPTSTAWFQYEDLQANKNDKLSKQITTLFETDRSNLDGLARVLRESDKKLPTIMISGSFDADAVANSVYNNYVLKRVNENSNLSKSDVTKESKDGFRQLSNDVLGRFAINDQVVLVQRGLSVDGEVTFDLEPYLNLYDENSSSLFEKSEQANSLLSSLDLQATSTWFDLESSLAESSFLPGAAGTNIKQLSTIGATQVVQTKAQSSMAFAAHFESEPSDSKISKIEKTSGASHLETAGNIAVFEQSASGGNEQDL
jgi:hypothetical protein